MQSERTLLQLEISNIRSDLTYIQQELHDQKRGDSKYYELMKREFEIIQKKNVLEDQYSILDKKEREMFSHLQAQINMLHEKSRTHTRQWGIISTVAGALLGIVGMSISAYYRNKEFRNIQQGIQQQIDQITKDTKQIVQGYSKLMSFLEKQELSMRQQQHRFQQQEKVNTISLRNSESWAGYLKRKTIFAWRFCTFQKTSWSLSGFDNKTNWVLDGKKFWSDCALWNMKAFSQCCGKR